MAFRQACPLHYRAWRLLDLHRNAIFGKQIAILCDPNWPIERTGKDHQPDGRHFGPATFSVVLLKKFMNGASICQSLDAIPPTVAKAHGHFAKRAIKPDKTGTNWVCSGLSKAAE